MGIRNRSNRFYVLLIGTILLLPLVIFSCHHYYSQSAHKALIDQFSISTKQIFDEKLNTDETLASVRYDAFLEKLQSHSKGHALLVEAYSQDNYAFRFIEFHSPSEKHALLLKRVKGLFEDGVNLKPYELEEHNQSFQVLAAYGKKIDEHSDIVVPAEEKKLLLEEINATPENKSITPMGIVDLVMKPENAGKYPTIQDAWKKAYQVAKQRANQEAEIEAGTGKMYFMMLDEMLINKDLFIKNWKLFASSPQSALEQIEPAITHYANLKKGLKKYREYAKKPFDDYQFKAGYKTKIKQGKKGADGELAVRIKKRLAAEGYWTDDFQLTWGDALTIALTRYQENHQVVADGVYGRGTAESFNITLQQRINQIRLTMMRMRNSNGRWDDYYVRINIPEMGLEVRENQKILKRHNLIVGNRLAKNHTPTFSDEIEKINFNPSWFVPQRIIKEEMQPGFDKDPENYFKKKGYRFKANEEGKVLAVTQPPGLGNALGRVKILFPNRYDVYLHDTPTKHLFKRTVRAYSHGCMRTHNAIDLAKFLLEKDGNPALEKVPNLLEKRIAEVIELKKKVPVHIEYVLASSNDSGEVIFFGDIYKQDVDTLLAMGDDPY